MDKILEKVIELVKEKASKKQIIAIVGLICLVILKATPLYVAVVVMYAITAQTVLEYKHPVKEKNHVKENSNGNVPAGN